MDPLEVNKMAPEFTLADIDGRVHSLSNFLGKLVILNFWSAECPWVQRADELLMDLVNTWGEGVTWISIASNANEPIDILKPVAAEREIPIILVDADQIIADLYNAQITPHIYLVDKPGVLRYQGALDDVSFRQSTPSQHYLKDAVESLMRGESPMPAETNPYGCALVRYAP